MKEEINKIIRENSERTTEEILKLVVKPDVIKLLPTDAEALWKAAQETVVLHHYNGDTRPPIEVSKYRTLQDYLNGNAREGN